MPNAQFRCVQQVFIEILIGKNEAAVYEGICQRDSFSSILGSAKVKHGFWTCAIAYGPICRKPFKVQVRIQESSSIAFLSTMCIKSFWQEHTDAALCRCLHCGSHQDFRHHLWSHPHHDHVSDSVPQVCLPSGHRQPQGGSHQACRAQWGGLEEGGRLHSSDRHNATCQSDC